jgi:hypothetical protein
LAVPYEMFKDYVVEGNAGAFAVDGLFQIPDNDEPIHIPAADDEAEEYIWTLKVTRAVADGRSVLVSVFHAICFFVFNSLVFVTDTYPRFHLQHFPRYVIENFDFSVGTQIDVMDDATGEMFQGKVKISTRPSGYVIKYLSQGWYQFVRSKELNPYDRIVFGVVNLVADLILRIHRA